MAKFKSGDVVSHKSNKNIDIVIIAVLTNYFSRPQTYKVRWYDNGEFHTGKAYEDELVSPIIK